MYSPRAVTQYSPRAISSHDLWHVPRAGASACSTSTTWVANLAVYCPIRIHERVTVYEWFWTVGTTATAHNVDFGVYREDFTAIQRLGPTAGGALASVLVNTATWTDLVLDPGSYYMAFWSDTARTFVCSTDALGLYQVAGCMEQVVATNLPSPAVPAAYGRAFLPSFGMNLTSVAL
jgi:hypothetical protein